MKSIRFAIPSQGQTLCHGDRLGPASESACLDTKEELRQRRTRACNGRLTPPLRLDVLWRRVRKVKLSIAPQSALSMLNFLAAMWN